jgi:hypothetical protein
LYDPATAIDTSVLINSLEAPETTASTTCPAVDVFPFRIEDRREVERSFKNMYEALADRSSTSLDLRELNEDLSTTLLDARLHRIPDHVLARTAMRVRRFQSKGEQVQEHQKINRAIIKTALSQMVN